MACPIRRHIRQTARKSQLREGTNLSFSEDGKESLHHVISGSPRPNNQQRTHGVKGARFNEYGDNGLAQSADSSLPRDGANVPGVQDEPDDDHQGEEDVERE